MRKRLGMNQTEAGKVIHSAQSNWSRWEAPRESEVGRPMPLAMWELFLLKVGLAELNGAKVRISRVVR
jgi:hypothetical protein